VGSQGLFSLAKLKAGLAQIEQENRELLEQNHLLQREIYDLRNNRSEIEKILREEYGYVADKEKVFVLPEGRENKVEP